MKILFDEKTIDKKIGELAVRISKDYAGQELVLISVLKGAAFFTADLMRMLTIPVVVEFVKAASYNTSTTPSNTVVIEQGLQTDLRGKQVLIADTIIDSGRTLETLMNAIRTHAPASLGVVALLDKKSRRCADIPVSYIGFEIPDVFVVGYGMDVAGQYRNLPYIAALRSPS